MHEKTRKDSQMKKAIFPLIMTIVSLAVFVWLYRFVTIVSFYLSGLLFAIPFVVFGIIALLAVKGKMKCSNIVTGALIPVFLVFTCICLTILSIGMGFTEVKDVSKYKRILHEYNYPKNELVSHFPAQIPQDTTDVAFYFKPRTGIAQDAEYLVLKFQTDLESIEKYTQRFSSAASWSGTKEQAWKENSHACYCYLSPVGYEELAEDFIIYQLYRDPKEGRNHGAIGFAVISSERCEIVFYAEIW